jgi:hypothetical protein
MRASWQLPLPSADPDGPFGPSIDRPGDVGIRAATLRDVLLSAAGAALLLVDFQQRLVPAIDGGPAVVANAVRLAEAARLLDVPACATEQYPEGLGHTVAELAERPQLVLSKTAFAATADPGRRRSCWPARRRTCACCRRRWG